MAVFPMTSRAEEILHHLASETSRIQHQFPQSLTPAEMYLQLLHTDVAEEIDDLCRSVSSANASKALISNLPTDSEADIHQRPTALECDVVRFQNNKDKWIAFVGLRGGRPYEIFTGIADDDYGIALPKSVTHGKIIRAENEDGSHRYDFQFVNSRGFKTTVEGLSYKFDPVFWNYAKLISGVMRYGMPIEQIIKILAVPQLDDENINSWTAGVGKALRRYIPGANTNESAE